VRGNSDSLHQLGILVDTDGHYANPNLLDRYLMQPSILRAFGWRFVLVLTKDWYHTPDDVLARIEKLLQGQEIEAEPEPEEALAEEAVTDPTPNLAPPPVETATEGTTEAGSQPPSILPGISKPSLVRHFEFIGGSSRKFWEISFTGNSFTVRFGRIGTAGQSQTKTFADDTKAQREAENLIAEKLKKGYKENSA
jgi:predicted DNA-binding WGR domain protein